MSLKFMNEKIKEWELECQNCRTRTIATLLSQLISVGKSNVLQYEKIIFLFEKNALTGKRTVEDLDEVIKNDNMDLYYSMMKFDSEKFMQNDRERFEVKTEKLKNSKEVKEIVNMLQNMSIDEMIKFYENLTVDANRRLEQSHQRILDSLRLFKRIFTYFLSFEETLVKQYEVLVKEAFEFHDYGRWEAIKQEFISIVISFNKYTGIVDQIAKIVNLFDKEKNKENFYTTAEKNILKMEQQLDALKIVEKLSEVLYVFLKNHKYELGKVNENEIDEMLANFHNVK